MGKNRPLPFLLSIVTECYVEYCFFRIKRAFLIGNRNRIFAYFAHIHNPLVQSGQQISSLVTGALFFMGLFCHRSNL